MKNRNVFIWGLSALLVTAYPALASDITSRPDSMTSITEVHPDSISSVIKDRPDSSRSVAEDHSDSITRPALTKLNFHDKHEGFYNETGKLLKIITKPATDSNRKAMESITEQADNEILTNKKTEDHPDSTTSMTQAPSESETKVIYVFDNRNSIIDIKRELHQNIESLRIPFDEYPNHKKRKEDYVKSMDDATTSIYNIIEEFHENIPLLRKIITEPIIKDDSETVIKLIAEQIVDNEILTKHLKKSLNKIKAIETPEQLKQSIDSIIKYYTENKKNLRKSLDDAFLGFFHSLEKKDVASSECAKYKKLVMLFVDSILKAENSLAEQTKRLKNIENMDDDKLKTYTKNLEEDLEKYQKVLDKHHECLYKVYNALVFDSTLKGAIINAIAEEKSIYSYSPYKLIPTSPYIDRKKFYGLDYRFLD